MKMIRWDPFRELETLSSRLNQHLGQPAAGRDDAEAPFADWAPAMDIAETDKEYLLKADLPEVAKENIKIGIEDGVLSLEGERKQEKEENTKKFHRVERVYGKFVRRIAVPSDVDQQHVAAEFKNGVLNVHLPKSASAQSRTIDVKVA
jgi:HSP20 family protein